MKETKINGVTLLSPSDANLIHETIRKMDKVWWLNTPSISDGKAFCVETDGKISSRSVDEELYIRPALIIAPGSDLVDGDKITIDDFKFDIVCNGRYALCTKEIPEASFLENADFDLLSAKTLVDDWYIEVIKSNPIIKIAIIGIA